MNACVSQLYSFPFKFTLCGNSLIKKGQVSTIKCHWSLVSQANFANKKLRIKHYLGNCSTMPAKNNANKNIIPKLEMDSRRV